MYLFIYVHVLESSNKVTDPCLRHNLNVHCPSEKAIAMSADTMLFIFLTITL